MAAQQMSSMSGAMNVEESELTDSWVALNLDADEERNSNENMKEIKRLLQEAQKDSGASSLCGSLKSGSTPETPANSLRTTPSQSGDASPKPKGEGNPQNPDESTKQTPDTDWVWDWSSTPENRPPKNLKFKRRVRGNTPLSMRKTSAMKSSCTSWSFLQVFIPSLILTNLFAFGFGIYFGKRLASSSKTV